MAVAGAVGRQGVPGARRNPRPNITRNRHEQNDHGEASADRHIQSDRPPLATRPGDDAARLPSKPAGAAVLPPSSASESSSKGLGAVAGSGPTATAGPTFVGAAEGATPGTRSFCPHPGHATARPAADDGARIFLPQPSQRNSMVAALGGPDVSGDRDAAEGTVEVPAALDFAVPTVALLFFELLAACVPLAPDANLGTTICAWHLGHWPWRPAYSSFSLSAAWQLGQLN